MARTGNAVYRRNRQIVLDTSDVCHICGIPGADSVDHVIPYALGGDDSIYNLKPAHLKCNKSRGKKNLEAVKVRKNPGYAF